jgi:hypothetical protein
MVSAILRRWYAFGAVIVFSSVALAQRPGSNERQVEPMLNVQDKADVWTMHFEHKDLRMLPVDVPGRGKKVVWYLWYKVINRTDREHTIIPDFELVPRDRGIILHDEVMPSVQEAIRKIEDPTNRYDVKNSVTISKTPIPPSKPDASPKAVYGVAIWADVNDKARDIVDFDIFISGLSNGWSIDDDGKIYRKTLNLHYKRLGDGSRIDSSEFRFQDYKWFYRLQSADVDLKPPASVQPKPVEK